MTSEPAIRPLPQADLRAFLGAVQADPDDPAPRLVFADWLEDHGDARAELLRLGVALAPFRDTPWESGAAPLRKCLRAWEKQHLPAWLPVRPSGLSVQFDTGLMSWHVNPRKWKTVFRRSDVRAILEDGWVEMIDVRAWEPVDWDTIRADWPALSAFTWLKLYRRWDVGGPLATLLELPRLTGLLAPIPPGVPPPSAAEYAPLGELAELRDLQPPQSTPEAFRALGKLPRLWRLIFSADPTFRDEHLAAVGAHPHLTSLYLTESGNLTDGGLTVLARMPRLRFLYLGAMQQVTRAGLAHVAGLRELRALHLSRSRGLTDDDLAALAPLRELRSLGLFGCEWVSDAGLEHLRPLTRLEELEVSSCPRVTPGAVRRLKRHWRQERAREEARR
jgi:uncharacterized protein (TIGR02996 family)